MKTLQRLSLLCIGVLVSAGTLSAQGWKAAEPLSVPEKRHENSMTAAKGKLYLLGGRGMKSVDEYDPKKDTWTSKSQTPLEMHHFQAVAFNNEIYVMGAFTGGYPHETPISNIYIYNPDKDEWRKGPEIPEARRRGAAGAFVHNNKIYLVDGIQDGHWDGHVAWFDEFDPKTGTWRQLPDAPHARDHVSVAVLDNKLYVAGGRLSTARINQVLNRTIPEVDVYDFKTNQWTTLDSTQNLPTLRAGNTTVAFGNKILVMGGESGTQVPAHSEVEAYNPKTKRWEKLPSLHQGRHGTGAVVLNGKVYIVAGSANRGGGPELNSMEVLEK
ncbi:Kelch repeat-containing protein [Telluribacter sp.]|jgi:N-acetylneuraminic acid mutarotase|uniref:Kelch repeat-containing protein n=1 Tax=Telluribacter sp. TaxID=1978767 RepID=UPI002E1026C3|nr:kelch repeat-containing protein [Telluribacter sp.]